MAFCNNYCSICTRATHCISGEGPIPSRFLAIGEAPGENEDKLGIPFVGKAGKEWNETYLHLAGIPRADVFVTNVRMCRPPNNRTPKLEEIDVCGRHHLPGEIEQVQPEVIFLLGATPCKLVPSINLETDHGIPQWCNGELYGWSGWIVPMYHPARGLHETADMIPMLDDWKGIREWLEDGVWCWPVDECPKTDYRLVESFDEAKWYLEAYGLIDGSDLMGVDTESHDGQHWSTQISVYPGTGIMAKAGSIAIELVNAAIAEWDEVVLHNGPADLPYIPKPKKYRDTMQEAKHLGNLQQKLKVLGYQLCGVRMQEWEDLVLPYSKQALLEWMNVALTIEEGRPIREEKQLKTKVKIIEKPNPTEKLLRRVLRYTTSNPEYDPWERLDGNGPIAIDSCGDFPKKGIAHVPIEEARDYGIRDADIALRVALKLEQLRSKFMGELNVQEEDYDKAIG